ncbi:MAG: hypothetical protein H0W14_04760, partial [Actinobacteria bacterium]|nr:hypothetical protein [Actinomycetota bacterium]
LLAVELERGWLLLADAGTRLRDLVERERDLSRWLEILPLYAGLPLDLADDADRLVSLGVPDLRLSRLPTLYEQLLDEVELPADERGRIVGSAARVGSCATSWPPTASRRRFSTTTSTTARSTCATAATSYSTGAMPA